MAKEGKLDPGDRVVVGAEEGRLNFEVVEGTAGDDALAREKA